MDAWGKTPSGILDGNLYDFGAFAECFQIERDNKLYHTKYCLAKLTLNWNRNSTIQPIVNGFTIGLCAPVVCTSEYIVKLLKINKKKYENVAVELLEDSCQLEEYISGLQTIDWVTM